MILLLLSVMSNVRSTDTNFWLKITVIINICTQ